MWNYERNAGMLEFQGKRLQSQGLYAGKDFFKVFSYELEGGNKNNALNEPYSIILSSRLADKLFGYVDVTGKNNQTGRIGGFPGKRNNKH